MPNKTIYVSEEDLPLFERAQRLASGSLSSAIAAALRQFVEREEAHMKGFDEVTVPIGKPGSRRAKRFHGRVLAHWGHQTGNDHTEMFTVYGTPKNQYAVHVELNEVRREWADSSVWLGNAEWMRWVPDWCRPFAQQMMSGQAGERGRPQWGLAPGCLESRLDVYPTVEDLEQNVPAELTDLVREAESDPQVEKLDI